MNNRYSMLFKPIVYSSIMICWSASISADSPVFGIEPAPPPVRPILCNKPSTPIGRSSIVNRDKVYGFYNDKFGDWYKVGSEYKFRSSTNARVISGKVETRIFPRKCVKKTGVNLNGGGPVQTVLTSQIPPGPNGNRLTFTDTLIDASLAKSWCKKDAGPRINTHTRPSVITYRVPLAILAKTTMNDHRNFTYNDLIPYPYNSIKIQCFNGTRQKG